MSITKNNSNWETERLKSESKAKNQEEVRGPFEIDKTRVIHSFPFRRLQGKFQMISGNECDFNRNRLTHSLEVASLSKNIYLNILDAVLKNKDGCQLSEQAKKKLFDKEKVLETTALLETISLLHDMGNPPFGHAGEVALNCMMYEHGGFEGNAQVLHMLLDDHARFPNQNFNLTKRAMLGIIKYPGKYSTLNHDKKLDKPVKNRMVDHEKWKPPKCYYDMDNQTVINEIYSGFDDRSVKVFQKYDVETEHLKTSKTKYKSFDCCIMDVADDISNAMHDLEDIIYLKKIKEIDLIDFLENNKKIQPILNDKKNCKSMITRNNMTIREMIENLFKKGELKSAIGDLVWMCVKNTKVYDRPDFDKGSSELLKYGVELEENCKDLVLALKNFVFKRFIKSDQVQTVVHGGMLVIMQLFEAYAANPKDLLSNDWWELYKNSEDHYQKRLISNMIAGMTDRYANRIHARLYGYNTRSMFEKI